MVFLDSEERMCETILSDIQDRVDPTWGFYVYGTFTSAQGYESAEGGSDEVADQEKSKASARFTDDNRFRAAVDKLQTYFADNLRYCQPAPYRQRLLDTFRLDSAARLPGASLAEVCTHFREHYALIIDSARLYEPGYQDSLDEEKIGPKFDSCLIIDDEVLQSIENGPEPIGPGQPDGVETCDRAYQAMHVFVKLLFKSYTTMKRPCILTAKYRDGSGGVEWDGWLKFSLVDFVRVFDELRSGDLETYYRGPDKVIDF